MTEDFAAYVSRKRLENVHGNHIEMQAMSEMYNRHIEVFCYSVGALLFESIIILTENQNNPSDKIFSQNQLIYFMVNIRQMTSLSVCPITAEYTTTV